MYVPTVLLPTGLRLSCATGALYPDRLVTGISTLRQKRRRYSLITRILKNGLRKHLPVYKANNPALIPVQQAANILRISHAKPPLPGCTGTNRFHTTGGSCGSAIRHIRTTTLFLAAPRNRLFTAKPVVLLLTNNRFASSASSGLLHIHIDLAHDDVFLRPA